MSKIILLIFLVLTQIARAEDIIFIVNAENPVSHISVSELRNFYFKKMRQWPTNDLSVRFIDRGAGSSVRDIFLKNYLKKTGSDVELYWIGQKLYTGDSAPIKEASDDLTIRFVSSFKGAIGYVPASAVLTDKNVKAVKVDSQED